MSCLVVLPLVLPATVAPIAWPLLVPAAVAAAAVMGFSAVQGKAAVEAAARAHNAVDLRVDGDNEIAASVAQGESLVFAKDDIQVVFSRDLRGKLSVKVHSDSLSQAELKILGEEFIAKVTQQYAYHRLMTELQQRNFTVAAEETEPDGTVKLQVRVYQGQ